MFLWLPWKSLAPGKETMSAELGGQAKLLAGVIGPVRTVVHRELGMGIAEGLLAGTVILWQSYWGVRSVKKDGGALAEVRGESRMGKAGDATDRD